jgi:hypothetical protein
MAAEEIPRKTRVRMVMMDHPFESWGLKATGAASTFDECIALVVTKTDKIFRATDFCHDRRGFPPQAGHNFARDERVSSRPRIRRDWAGVRRNNFAAFSLG